MAEKMEWKEKLEKFKGSGLSQKEWCKENDVPASTLSTWLTKDSKPKSDNKRVKEQKWIKTNIITSNTKPIEIKIGKLSVILEKNYDKELFQEVMKELISLC